MSVCLCECVCVLRVCMCMLVCMHMCVHMNTDAILEAGNVGSIPHGAAVIVNHLIWVLRIELWSPSRVVHALSH